jgi:hypothetical protein
MHRLSSKICARRRCGREAVKDGEQGGPRVADGAAGERRDYKFLNTAARQIPWISRGSDASSRLRFVSFGARLAAPGALKDVGLQNQIEPGEYQNDSDPTVA